MWALFVKISLGFWATKNKKTNKKNHQPNCELLFFFANILKWSCFLPWCPNWTFQMFVCVCVLMFIKRNFVISTAAVLRFFFFWYFYLCFACNWFHYVGVIMRCHQMDQRPQLVGIVKKSNKLQNAFHLIIY